MDKNNLFWVFGTIQALSLSAIIYLVFRSLNMIAGISTIGQDTQIVLSVMFPLFLLVTEYMIYSKD